jgi:hypothetical protein
VKGHHRFLSGPHAQGIRWVVAPLLPGLVDVTFLPLPLRAGAMVCPFGVVEVSRRHALGAPVETSRGGAVTRIQAYRPMGILPTL